jgi:hypothetical protein
VGLFTCKPAALIGPSQRAISSTTYLARYSAPRRSDETGCTCNFYSITTNQVVIINLFWVINRYVGNLN